MSYIGQPLGYAGPLGIVPVQYGPTRYPPIRLYYRFQPIENNRFVDLFDVIETPQVEFNAEPQFLYTILLVDYDAPNPPFAHWLIINNDQVVVPYLPPSPPEGEVHSYQIFVFEQDRPISVRWSGKRENAPVKELVRQNRLRLIGRTSFRTGNI